MIEADYFERKRRELGLDREGQLKTIQAWLEQRYPGQVRARQLHRGVLKLETLSASVASELRLRQTELLDTCKLGDTRLAIRIGSLD